MSNSDDEDWLYRRGQYGGDRRDPAPGPSPEVPSAPLPENPDALYRDQGTVYGAPTPVGHYGASGQPGPPRTEPLQAAPPRAPQPPVARPPRRRRRRHPVRNTLIVVAAYLLGVPLATWPFMPRVDAAPDGDRPASQPGQVIVLAGSDSREGLSKEEKSDLGTGSAEGRRADTIMLLYLPRSGDAALISLPRDSFVDIPGHGQNKINAAYAFGGPELLVETVETNTGLQVDGYAEIGFGGFVNAVDAVGGIEMCPENAIKDKDSQLDIPAGCQEMDGITALGYVRMRKADPKGDIGRAERQREMLDALASKVISPATILLPWRWVGINYALSRAVTLGEDVGLLDLIGMGRSVVKIGTGSGQTFVVPLSSTNASTSAGSSVLWDDAEADDLFATMKKGEAVDAFAD
ncbi:MAG: LCP family protein [Propioniciclava sp.]